MDVMRENDLPFCYKTDTKSLISNIDSIVNNFKRLSTVKVSKKEKVNDLIDTCLLDLRAFYDSMNDYIYGEYIIWEIERRKQEEE